MDRKYLFCVILLCMAFVCADAQNDSIESKGTSNEYWENLKHPLLAYTDKLPQLKKAQRIRDDTQYNESDSTTYPVFTSLPKTYPLTTEEMGNKQVAMWFAKEFTCVTYIFECTEARTVCRFNPPTHLSMIPMSNDIKIHGEHWSVMMPMTQYPLDKFFIIEAEPGDYVIIEMYFEPIPLGTQLLSVYIDFGEEAVSHNTENSLDSVVYTFYNDLQPLYYYIKNQEYIKLNHKK